MSLANYYRPETFVQFEGNETEVEKVSKALKREKEKIPHCFFISGDSGLGKTTLARIIARRLKIYDPSKSMNIDFVEMNTADKTGVDNIRERIISVMNLNTYSGGNRGFLLDECHMLSKSSQNALLKALEEAPEHVFFFLCTTDPKDIIPTIKRRCLQVNLKPLNDDEMDAYISSVFRCEKTKLKNYDDIIPAIVDKSNGSPGVAIGIVDSILDLEEDEMLEAVQGYKNIEQQSIDLCRAIIKKERWDKIKVILSSLKDSKESPETIRRVVVGYANSILLNKRMPRAYLVLEAFSYNTFDTGFPMITKACWEVLEAD